MSGFRIPGSLGIGIDLPIDSGTLSRTMSFIPGPLGVEDPLMQIARRVIRRGVHEGASLAAEVLVKAALLELEKLRGNVEAQLRLIASLPDSVRRQVAYDAFASAFDHPLPKKFLRHYIWSEGAPLTLSEREMIDCNPYISLFNDRNRPVLQPFLDSAEARPGVPMAIKLDIAGGALTNGTLGNFTVKIAGTATMRPIGGSIVVGEMSFYDVWDFDPKPYFVSGRSVAGEVKTRVGATYLPGKPFKIFSATVPFEQTQADPTVVWSGGMPKGVPDRVSTAESSG